MPEIISTGLVSPAIQIKELDGEPHEAIRADAGNLTYAAAYQIYFLREDEDDSHGELAAEYLRKLGMDEINVCRIVGAAAAGITGFGAIFKTRFLEPDRIGGPRVYEDFLPINRNNQP
ncbi:MAG: hypothetical protein PHQ59_03270 [Candidatus Daviesbacteria bacterium]|nr:hypothetical protein [Candidatus Daviesbacteria bacterium]